MLVSEYYPEMFQRKRSIKDHEEWGKIKSMILLELMKGPDTRSGLKLKVNEQLKREGSLPISIKTVVRHLRNPDKTGLIDLGIVRERDGLLELSLTTPRKIAKFIDELSKNKTIGPRVSYFIDRMFAEAFFSAFGDRFINSPRINNYISDEIKKELKGLNIKEDWSSYIAHYIVLLIHYEGEKDIIDKLNGQISEESKKALKIWKQLDVLSIILGASREIRGNIDTLFKVSYILMVLSRIELSRKIEIDENYGDIVNLLDLTIFQYPNSLILDFKPIDSISEEFVLEKFLQLLREAISGELKIDRTFNKEFSILRTLKPDLTIEVVEVNYSIKLAEMLLKPLFGKELTTKEEAQKLTEIRKQKRLRDSFPLFIYP